MDRLSLPDATSTSSLEDLSLPGSLSTSRLGIGVYYQEHHSSRLEVAGEMIGLQMDWIESSTTEAKESHGTLETMGDRIR